jgi:hypothetical protein
MIHEKLRAPSEEVCQRGTSLISLESIILLNPNPRQLLTFSRHLVAPPSKILLGLE